MCLVGLLSYAGLRPGEALALRFSDLGQRTIAVDKAVSFGEERSTKTGAARSVPLVAPLRVDLDAWREIRSLTDDDALVFPRRDGHHWSRPDFANWRRRTWKPTMRALATTDRLQRLATARPYDCRGSFVSLHLRAGASPLEVASWAGHSPHVMFRHYANVIEELVGEPVLSAEEQIWRARGAVLGMADDELAEAIADLMDRPTVADPDASSAADVLYSPEPSERPSWLDDRPA